MKGLLKRRMKETGEAVGGLLSCVPSSAPTVNSSSVTSGPKTWGTCDLGDLRFS